MSIPTLILGIALGCGGSVLAQGAGSRSTSVDQGVQQLDLRLHDTVQRSVLLPAGARFEVAAINRRGFVVGNLIWEGSRNTAQRSSVGWFRVAATRSSDRSGVPPIGALPSSTKKNVSSRCVDIDRRGWILGEDILPGGQVRPWLHSLLSGKRIEFMAPADCTFVAALDLNDDYQALLRVRDRVTGQCGLRIVHRAHKAVAYQRVQLPAGLGTNDGPDGRRRDVVNAAFCSEPGAPMGLVYTLAQCGDAPARLVRWSSEDARSRIERLFADGKHGALDPGFLLAAQNGDAVVRFRRGVFGLLHGDRTTVYRENEQLVDIDANGRVLIHDKSDSRRPRVAYESLRVNMSALVDDLAGDSRRWHPRATTSNGDLLFEIRSRSGRLPKNGPHVAKFVLVVAKETPVLGLHVERGVLDAFGAWVYEETATQALEFSLFGGPPGAKWGLFRVDESGNTIATVLLDGEFDAHGRATVATPRNKVPPYLFGQESGQSYRFAAATVDQESGVVRTTYQRLRFN